MNTADVYSTAGLRRATWQFLTGKAASALLTFALLLALVRLLPVSEYGVYVTFVALIELGYALAGLGLPWLAARQLPEVRLKADGRSLHALAQRLIAWQALALLGLTLAGGLLIAPSLNWLALPFQYTNVAWAALGVLFVEGLGQFCRESLMGPLLLQGPSRASLVLRQGSLLAGVGALNLGGLVTVNNVLLVELGASLLALALASHLLFHHLRNLQHQPAEAHWKQPTWSTQWRQALPMYGAHLLTLTYTPQVFIVLAQRMLGSDAAALLGFLRTLYQQMAGYLPATLLMTLIRPKLVASYVQQGMPGLCSQANLAGKLSLAALMPMLACVALGGDALLALLSGEKFTQAGLLFFALLLALVPFSQRQIVETVAVVAGQAKYCARGAALGLTALPIAWFSLLQGAGLWGLVMAILSGEILFIITVLWGLARAGYRQDWRALSLLALAALIAWLSAVWIVLMGARTPAWLIVALTVAGATYLGALWVLKPFSGEEMQRLRGFMRRPTPTE